MNRTKSQGEIVARRAELLVELFLQDIGATYHSGRGDDFGYDFIAAFPNAQGGTNFSAVQVKATDRPIEGFFALDSKWYNRFAHSNIPLLLLVVDTKHNRMFHAWLDEDVLKLNPGNRTVRVPVVPIDDTVRGQIRKRLSGNQRPPRRQRSISGPSKKPTPPQSLVPTLAETGTN
ncbi:MAG: DUF4365 domain-containing protein [Acidobacteria bacterium]|nr:DUF4365 domain-containing protein [Acidobacteriota bacterium]